MVGFASGVMIASSKIKFHVAKSWLNWKKKNTRNEILIRKPRKSVIKYRYRYEIDVIIKIAIAFYCLDVSNMNLESLTNVNRCEASAPSVLYTYKYMHLRLFRIEESSSWFALHQSCRIAQYRRAKPPRRRSSRQESSYGMNLLCFQVFFPLDYDFSRSRFRLESNNARAPLLLVGIFWNHHFLFACTWTGQDVTRYDDEEHLKAAGKYLLAFNGKPYPSSEPGQVFERAGAGGGEVNTREIYRPTNKTKENGNVLDPLPLLLHV